MSTADWLPPLVRAENLTQITEHVYIIPDDSVAGVPNVGIIVGSRAVLVIDTGIGERNGFSVLEAARTLAADIPLRLVTTHIHPEHDLGAQAFPADTVMIRARTQVDEIAEQGLKVADDFRRRSSDYAALLEGAAFRDADVVFNEMLELDLGGVHVHIRAMGANHTRGDTVILVAEDAVLFSGDIAMRPQPAFASPWSSMDHWLASLDELESMNARIIVPSHGPVGGTELIHGYRAYLLEVRRRTAAARAAGRTAEQAVEEVTAALVDRYPDVSRIAGAVRAAYTERQEHLE